jgi:putative membrane protein
MKHPTRLMGLGAALISLGALAQSTPPPAAQSPPQTDGAFVQQAAEINRTELELSKLARNNSSTPVIIKFSSAMVRRLTQAEQSLGALAEQNAVAAPASLNAEDAAMVKRLSEEKGGLFDLDYAKDMAANEDRGVALYRTESAGTSSPVASYAQKTLPTLDQDDKVAQNLATTIGPGTG